MIRMIKLFIECIRDNLKWPRDNKSAMRELNQICPNPPAPIWEPAFDIGDIVVREYPEFLIPEHLALPRGTPYAGRIAERRFNGRRWEYVVDGGMREYKRIWIAEYKLMEVTT